MVTDGQLPIRQCLHPEAWRKEFELPDYYNRFHDLRKEVATFLKKEEQPASIPEILDRILFSDLVYWFIDNLYSVLGTGCFDAQRHLANVQSNTCR